MQPPELPCLSLALKPLNSSELGHFAIWVLQAPTPGGYVHEEALCTPKLAKTWREWQAFFSVEAPLPDLISPHLLSPSKLTAVKRNLEHGAGHESAGHESAGHGSVQAKHQPIHPSHLETSHPALINLAEVATATHNGTQQNLGQGSAQGSAQGSPPGVSSLVMQELGLQLWQWLFTGTLQRSLAQSQGIAIGQQLPLRLRLDIRDPIAVSLPWEIATPSQGKPALSLDPHFAFSRTTSDVAPLSLRLADQQIRVLLVLGDDAAGRSPLALHTEARHLAETLMQYNVQPHMVDYQVTTIVQPSTEELLECLNAEHYSIFMYMGHGQPAPDGGALRLSDEDQLSGTELAQVLVRSQVTLAVFNACWGARSHCTDKGAIPRSSLAEVLIHHGIPAVLAMRDAIADEEALSFTGYLAQAIARGNPIDRAVAIARQQLLTLYKFNQPAWTLPILYMHPEFNGLLLNVRQQVVTELPDETDLEMNRERAYLRCLDGSSQRWTIRRGLMRVGRTEDNDIVVPERWVSQQHAEIFVRQVQAPPPTSPNPLPNSSPNHHLPHHSPTPHAALMQAGYQAGNHLGVQMMTTSPRSEPRSDTPIAPLVNEYVLRDRSRYGTLIAERSTWRKIHHQEIALRSGMRIKFGSSQGQALEFIVD